MPFLAPVIGFVAASATAVGTFIGGLGIVGSLAVGAGLSVAIGYIQSKLIKNPGTDTSSNLPAGVNFERQYGENVPRQVPCGICAVAGHDVYVNTYSTSNNLLQQIYVVGDYYTSGLRRVAIGGEWQTLGGVADPVKGYPITSGSFANLIWIKFFDGRQTEADAGLVAHANPSDRWTAEMIGVGMSFILVSMTYDQDKNNSFPDFFFEFNGAPLYDWRKDTSVGGDGAHRWNDVSTHEFSQNPILMEYNYRRGFSINDDLFCGMQMPATDLPLDKFTTAANICDEVQDDTYPRYVCSIFFDCMTTHGDNLQSVALSCGALQIDGVDGSWPVVGSDQPTVMTITDDDFISVEDRNFQKLRSMGDLVNSVSGNYPEPSQNWSMIGYDPQVASDLVVADRRDRDINMDFSMVPSARQAAQLAWIYLWENRFEATLDGTLRPRFQVLEPGDWISYVSDLYGTYTMIVTSAGLVSLDDEAGPRNSKLTFQQRDGKIYDGVTPPVIVFPTPPGEPVYASELDSFDVIAVTVVGDDGRTQAAMRVSWAAILDTTITSAEIHYYPVSDPDSVISKIVTRDTTVVTLSEGVVGNTLYHVAAKIITNPSRTTTFNAGKDVTTLNVGGSVGLNDIDASIFATLGALEGSLRDQIEILNTRINKMALNDISRSWLDRKVLRQDLYAQAGGAKAAIEEVRTIAVDTQEALAETQDAVSVEFDDQSALITTNATAIANVAGYAAANWTVTLDVNNYVVGMQIYNGGVGISGMAFTVDTFKIARPGVAGSAITMFEVGTINGVTTAGIRGDLVLDGTLAARALVSTSVDAYFATFGTMTAGTIQSADGKYVIDLSNGREIISD